MHLDLTERPIPQTAVTFTLPNKSASLDSVEGASIITKKAALTENRSRSIGLSSG